MIGESPVRRYQISLPPEIADRVRAIGLGNMSAGIRLLLARDAGKRKP
jgi:hypothetical protein